MQKIAGQKPVTTKARKSIAGFKIRDGYPIGCMVTLRGPRMFEFLIAWLPSMPCRASVTSVVSLARVLMARATTTWASRNRSFSGNRVRQDRCSAGYEHQHHHDREDRCRSQGPAASFKFPFKN